MSNNQTHKTAAQFGFTVNPCRQLDLDNADLSFEQYLHAQGLMPDRCIQCATCSGSCPTNGLFSFRKLIAGIRRGHWQEEAAKSAHCLLCGVCSSACPQGLPTRAIIAAALAAMQDTY